MNQTHSRNYAINFTGWAIPIPSCVDTDGLIFVNALVPWTPCAQGGGGDLQEDPGNTGKAWEKAVLLH